MTKRSLRCGYCLSDIDDIKLSGLVQYPCPVTEIKRQKTHLAFHESEGLYMCVAASANRCILGNFVFDVHLLADEKPFCSSAILALYSFTKKGLMLSTYQVNEHE